MAKYSVGQSGMGNQVVGMGGIEVAKHTYAAAVMVLNAFEGSARANLSNARPRLSSENLSGWRPAPPEFPRPWSSTARSGGTMALSPANTSSTNTRIRSLGESVVRRVSQCTIVWINETRPLRCDGSVHWSYPSYEGIRHPAPQFLANNPDS